MLNARPKHRWTTGIAAVLLAGSMLTATTGCAGNDAQAGALLGAGAGALGGAIIGHNQGRRTAEGAGIGAGIGAVTGYIIGNESDKAKMQRQHHYNYRY